MIDLNVLYGMKGKRAIVTGGSSGIGLGINTTYGGIQIQAAGNLFLSAGTGGAITLRDNRIVLAGALCLGGSSYGTSAPTGTGAAGQLYVQLVS